MADFNAIPLIADKNNIRIDKFSQPSSIPVASPVHGPAPSSNGVAQFANSPVAEATNDGELSPEDVQHLQAAAESGDQESISLLKALGIPLGAAAAIYGAGVGGTMLANALARSQGLGNFAATHGPGGATSANSTQLRLPAPTAASSAASTASMPPQQLTDQTAGRFNQPAPIEPAQLTDQRAIYEKTGGKLPTGKKAGDLLREAARLARRMH